MTRKDMTGEDMTGEDLIEVLRQRMLNHKVEGDTAIVHLTVRELQEL